MSQHSPTSTEPPDESANIQLVENFFADWGKRDAQILASYLANNFAYQMIEGEPDIIGPRQFVDTLKDALSGFTKIDMHIRRIACFGHVVMVDRYDQMTGKDDAHSMNFEVAAMLVVREGKICVLRDFPIPGGIFELGDAWLEGTPAYRQRLDTAARYDQ